MLKVSHAREQRFEVTRVEATCDECGLTALALRRMRAAANVEDARVNIRASGWQITAGGKLYCPRHVKKSGNARNEGK